MCNYVFEYDAPRAAAGAASAPASPLMIPILIALAVAGAVLTLSVVKLPARHDGFPLGLVLTFGGLFSVTGAVANWSWFMMARRARLVTMLLSRTGARLFYALLGGLLLGAGLDMGLT